MRFFDLHCDTLYKAVTQKATLNEQVFEVSIEKGRKFKNWRECTAIWIPDELTAEEGMSLFMDGCKVLQKESVSHNISICENKCGSVSHEFIFTVENGAFLNGDLNNVLLLKQKNVRVLTLTWNAENCIGGGADAPGVGLKEFGKMCVKELENMSIVIDVSHASDKLFYDVCEHTTKPFVATHSNSRSVCGHRRNLTDDQFSVIRQRGGLVGLNFHRDFLCADAEKACIKNVLLHAEHLLSLGGEDVLCIGSDFDGSDVPQSLSGIEKIPDLYEAFLKCGYNEQLVQKIFYDNAYNFFTKF